MLSHLSIGTNDFERAVEFYAALLEPLGLELYINNPKHPWAIWREPGHSRPLFIVTKPYDGQDATPGNGQMTAFLAPDRPTVDRCYDIAMARGACDEGKPGLRRQYHPNYYGAYFRDLDGNKLCVVCHGKA